MTKHSSGDDQKPDVGGKDQAVKDHEAAINQFAARKASIKNIGAMIQCSRQNDQDEGNRKNQKLFDVELTRGGCKLLCMCRDREADLHNQMSSNNQFQRCQCARRKSRCEPPAVAICESE